MPLRTHMRIRIVVRAAAVALVGVVVLVTTGAPIGVTGAARAEVSTAPAHRLVAACVCWG
ncbi:heme A synthase [Catenulispora sp. GAS73]|uniref:hypothetical protein n=1 Tax=Catenulispora sp. GAS73 TaxID=3156269 RepID=UPI0035121880